MSRKHPSKIRIKECDGSPVWPGDLDDRTIGSYGLDGVQLLEDFINNLHDDLMEAILDDIRIACYRALGQIDLDDEVDS
jgi:hypothetical protein